MSSIARQTVRHAYDDLGALIAGGTDSRERRSRASGFGSRARRLSHPVRRLFGESRGVTWGVICVLVMVGLMLVRPMVMSLVSWHRTAALLDGRRTEVRQLEVRNDKLEQQLAFYRTDAFVAERAREYGLVKPGETPFVVREIVHPDAAGHYAVARLRNATVDYPVAVQER